MNYRGIVERKKEENYLEGKVLLFMCTNRVTSVKKKWSSLYSKEKAKKYVEVGSYQNCFKQDKFRMQLFFSV